MSDYWQDPYSERFKRQRRDRTWTHKTNRGRVVYDRKEHKFRWSDVLRIVKALSEAQLDEILTETVGIQIAKVVKMVLWLWLQLGNRLWDILKDPLNLSIDIYYDIRDMVEETTIAMYASEDIDIVWTQESSSITEV